VINFASQLLFYETFPQNLFDFEKDLLIIDQWVDQQYPAIAKKFKYVYRVQAGESLKSLTAFAQHVEAVLDLWDQPLSRNHCVVSCGGGSVGDFSGFLASILKRGLRLVQCPTTWLSAIDSAHGGKTALNVKSVKNQVGTFYPAESVLLIKELLQQQGPERAQEGLGELIKVALTDQPSFFHELTKNPELKHEDIIWQNLERAIQAKNKIVLQDPFETKGLRKILNFGHTLGHVIEAHYQVSHGESVLQGLYFAIEWSAKCGLLPEAQSKVIFQSFEKMKLQSWLETNQFIPMKLARVQQLVMFDKKITSDAKIDFVFLADFGLAKVMPVTLPEFLSEVHRQGWAVDV
jgi:3-dehydroquinate synthase